MKCQKMKETRTRRNKRNKTLKRKLKGGWGKKEDFVVRPSN